MWAFIIVLFLVLVYYCEKESHKGDVQSEKERVIRTLHRQCARWSTASAQDTSPVIATLHANYAAGYLWALEDLYSANEISAATHVLHHDFRNGIQKNQDISTRKLIEACPAYAKIAEESSVLIAKSAGEN